MNSPGSLQAWRKQVDVELARQAHVKTSLEEEQQQLVLVDLRCESLREAQSILQGIAQAIQQKVHAQIADIVTRCLATVFDEPYIFKIVFEQKRGRTEARLVFTRNGHEIDPLTASGGGVVDVAAFALRLSCLLLQRPPVRKLLVMDEPFKFVSSQYIPRVRSLLETLSEEMGVQIIMVTHIEGLKTGELVSLE